MGIKRPLIDVRGRMASSSLAVSPREVLVKATPLRTLRGFMDEHLSAAAVQKVFDRAGWR